jgi:hypothetical protein
MHQHDLPRERQLHSRQLARVPAGPVIQVKTPSLPSRKYEDLTERQRRVFATPAGFAKFYLGLDLLPKQVEILNAFGPLGARVSACTCNEFGKTTRVIAPLVLWHMSVFPRAGNPGGCISTSGSWTQITNQLVPALRSYRHRFPGYVFLEDTIKSPNECPQWVGFSTTNPGRAEGSHGHAESPLLVIVDEAKTVRDEIFSAVDDRCNPQRIGLLSSPGYAEGEFYRSHTRNADLYQRFKATAQECPHISPESIERRIKKHGLNHPLVRSAIFAEFMEEIGDALVSFTEYDLCAGNPPAFNHGAELHVFLDFAAGGDENVIGVRQGNRCWIHKAWQETDTMKAAGQFAIELHELNRRLGVMPEHVEGDDCGLGKVMIDRLHELGWPILRFNGGAPAIADPIHFTNRNAEVWWTGADRIRTKSVILPDKDEDLRAQVCNRKKATGPKGKQAIESKDDLMGPGRNQPSPDRADAIFGALGPLPVTRAVQVMNSPQTIGERLALAMQNQMRVPEALLAGMDTGG